MFEVKARRAMLPSLSGKIEGDEKKIEAALQALSQMKEELGLL